MSSHRRTTQWSASLVGAAAFIVLSAGCGPSASSGAPASAGATVVAATAATETTSGTPVPAQPTPTNGPTDYAAWVERQGFGGSSGLRNVHKLAVWLGENTTNVTAFDLRSDQADIRALATWLGDHPATACWAEYRAATQADLATLDTLYDTAIESVGTGSVASETARDIIAAATAALERPQPPNCP